jgi:phosphoribosylformylglycinamidine cyclo-ligase
MIRAVARPNREKLMSNQSPLTYAGAGVDIDEGARLVDKIAPLAKATQRAGVMGGLGGFAAGFDLKAAGFLDPILLSTTDGVGTKLKIAIETGRHATIGIDLVGMCVNDLLCSGGEPLFFLDYFATGKLSAQAGAAIIAGIAQGCHLAGCALVGGETAEMPGLYADGDYDLAGFSVGAAEREQLLPKLDTIQPGDVLIGLASSGPHSNGYSLIRKIVARSGLAWTAPAPFAPGRDLADALLEPTRIYVKPLLPLIHAGLVKGLAHITGGGLVENTPRMLPSGMEPAFDWSGWRRPAVFDWLAEIGATPEDDMRRTFNLGIGMVACVGPAEAPETLEMLLTGGEDAFIIGEVRGS